MSDIIHQLLVRTAWILQYMNINQLNDEENFQITVH